MVDAKTVAELRAKTGAGMMDCKKALTETNGNLEAAIDYLREKGIAKAAKKESRIAAEGLANVYISGNKAVIIEVNSETDFVSKNEEFREMLDTIGNTILNSDTHPFIVVMGGKKVDDKIVLIEKLLEKGDKLLIGGAMSFTFLKALGYNVGNSIVSEEHILFCKNMLDKYQDKIVLPKDFITEKGNMIENKLIEHFDNDDIGYDIGSKTVKEFNKILGSAKRVILNGPMGMFEEGRFSNGTLMILKQLSEIKAKTVVGGGDTASAVNKLGFANKFYHVSTGGGATMKYLEDGKLIGIEVISDEEK